MTAGSSLKINQLVIFLYLPNDSLLRKVESQFQRKLFSVPFPSLADNRTPLQLVCLFSWISTPILLSQGLKFEQLADLTSKNV